MKRDPCFLMMAGFLLATIGCAASHLGTPLKIAHEEAAKPTTARTEPATAEPRFDFKPSSLYAEMQDGMLGQYSHSKPVPVQFVCVLTGDFNITPDGNALQMATWCVEEEPIPGNGVTMLPVEDTVASRVPGKHIYRILFRDAVVSVADIGGQQEVRLHYRDPSGSSHNVLLTPQTDEPYRYSFMHLNPDTVEPLGERRVITIER